MGPVKIFSNRKPGMKISMRDDEGFQDLIEFFEENGKWTAFYAENYEAGCNVHMALKLISSGWKASQRDATHPYAANVEKLAEKLWARALTESLR